VGGEQLLRKCVLFHSVAFISVAVAEETRKFSLFVVSLIGFAVVSLDFKDGRKFDEE
jgi:hypothetical protein